MVLSCKTLVKLFVSKGLIPTFFGLFDEHRLICCNIPCFYLKAVTWSKENKDGNPFPHKCSLIIVLWSSGRKFLVWLCKETSYNNINMAGPRKISEQNITNFLFCVLRTYLAISIKNKNPNL